MDVSVVVPARNASATLPATLRALERQDFAGEYEVIVVDNCSRDDTGELARAAGVRVLRMKLDRGPGPARNAGARAGTAPVVAFTDADCEPAPDWLTAGLAALEAVDIVQGAVSPTPGVEVGPFDRTVWVGQWTGLFETANLLVRREVFERCGGFWPFLDGENRLGDEPGLRPSLDEGPFGEDLWFGYRAMRDGARTAFASDALVHHAVFPRGIAGFVRERRRTRYFPAAVRVAPELRGFFWQRYFLSARSAAFDAAVVGVLGAAAARRPVFAALALPYARMATRGARPWRRSSVVAAGARCAADAVGAVNLWRGSAAARTPVL
jgi:glycosyltransferase involved in cell wall biosynthesis